VDLLGEEINQFSTLSLRTGWAITMLSEENKGYASTCQTIGLTVGQFLSFTIFLAFNSVEFRWALKFLHALIPLFDPQPKPTLAITMCDISWAWTPEIMAWWNWERL